MGLSKLTTKNGFVDFFVVLLEGYQKGNNVENPYLPPRKLT